MVLKNEDFYEFPNFVAEIKQGNIRILDGCAAWAAGFIGISYIHGHLIIAFLGKLGSENIISVVFTEVGQHRADCGLAHVCHRDPAARSHSQTLCFPRHVQLVRQVMKFWEQRSWPGAGTHQPARDALLWGLQQASVRPSQECQWKSAFLRGIKARWKCWLITPLRHSLR